MCSLRTLVEVAQRLARPGRAGSARVIRVLGARPEFEAAADSHLEVRLLDALRAVGCTGFVRQPEVRLPSGQVIHPDLGIPELGFYVEVDHHTWHGGREAVDYDKARDRQLRLTGAVVERVTDQQINQSLPAVVGELLALVAQRRRSFGAEVLPGGT